MEYPNNRDYTMVYVTHEGFLVWEGTKREYDNLLDGVKANWEGFAIQQVRNDESLRVAIKSWEQLQ